MVGQPTIGTINRHCGHGGLQFALPRIDFIRRFTPAAGVLGGTAIPEVHGQAVNDFFFELCPSQLYPRTRKLLSNGAGVETADYLSAGVPTHCAVVDFVVAHCLSIQSEIIGMKVVENGQNCLGRCVQFYLFCLT
jgi:hypothetical protein